MSSLLARTLGDLRDQDKPSNRRSSGGNGSTRATPYERPSGGSWKHDMYQSKSETAPINPRLAATLDSVEFPAAKSPRLVISNLHYEVSERELEQLFAQIGPIVLGPKIKFDRAGRSEGVAHVTYSSEEHAEQAKEAFDGALAKGEKLSVEYDFKFSRADPGHAAQGTLLSRLNEDSDSRRPLRRPSRGQAPSDTPRGPVAERATAFRGNGDRSQRGFSRAAGRGGRGGGSRAAARPAPKTNEDLDRELSEFMNQPAAAKESPAGTAAAASTTVNDVEMS